jgi:hypothetical protein
MISQILASSGWRSVCFAYWSWPRTKDTQANIESLLALDIKYLENHLEPVAKWGEQEPHK